MTKEEKEKAKREKMGGYFLDLSKLAFAAMVLGSITPIFHEGTSWDWVTFALGVALTMALARIGYNILNN